MRRRSANPRVNLVLSVGQYEQVGKFADRFRTAEEQKSIWAQRIVEGGDQLTL
jgi:hypothetical protein